MHFKRFFQKIGLYRERACYHYQLDENKVEVLNFWTSQRPQDFWIYQFMLEDYLKRLPDNESVLLASVFGPREAIRMSKSKVKIFYTGENLSRFHEYKDHCIRDVDLAIGFGDLPCANYVRFPIWLFYFFHPRSDLATIQYTVKNFVSDAQPVSEKRFCSLVASHDKNGNRSRLFSAMNRIDRVDSVGKLLNNSDRLRVEFNDNKQLFLQHYKFNICPENTNRKGYVTEKIFEAIQAGTVPVYWGGDLIPEPEILNQDAILFYKGRSHIGQLVRRVEELNNNPKLYKEFAGQPRFTRHAAECIADRFSDLHNKFRVIFSPFN